MASADQQLIGVTGKDRIKVGVGTSEVAGSGEAGRSAAAMAVAGLAGEPPALVLVFGSVKYQLPELLAGVRSVTGATPLAGASSSGHLYNGVVMPPEQGVVVVAATAGPYRFGIGSVTGLNRGSAEAGRALARAARRGVGPEPSPYAALVLFSDGLLGNQQALVSGVHKVTGAAVPVVGGAAGDDRRWQRTSVFHGDRVLPDAAVAIWIGSPWPLPVAAGHGWRPVGTPLLVTGVNGRVLTELAGRDALEVLREHFQPAARDRQPGWLHEPGPHAAHAVGLIQPDGSQVIRSVHLGADGQLRTSVPVPVYTPIQVVTCRPDDMLSVVGPLVSQATAGRDPTLLLAFSCLYRLDMLGAELGAEAAALQRAAGAATTVGFCTYGEFARTTGAAGYHNCTLSMIAL